MHRIIIFGNSGAGKSTLAKALAERHALGHLDLDHIAWQATEPPTRAPLAQTAAQIAAFTQAHASWVMEGCYADLLALAAANCSLMIFLNPSVEVCLAHCRARPWEAHKYASKAAQDVNLPMLLEWVAQYGTRSDAFSLLQHRALFDQHRGRKFESTNTTLDLNALELS